MAKKKGPDPMLLYGGIGGGALLLIIVIVAASSGREEPLPPAPPTTKSATSRPHKTTPVDTSNLTRSQPGFSYWMDSGEEKLDGPIKDQAEAERLLGEATAKMEKAINLEGEARNRLYREVKKVCGDLQSSPISEGVRRKASKMFYTANKHQTAAK